MGKKIIDKINFRHELPNKLGKISDIKARKISINPKKLRNLSLKLIKELSGTKGFINSFFSPENHRYKKIITSGKILDSSKKISDLFELEKIDSSSIPFTPVIAISGGPDSGLTARLFIESYLNRPEKEKCKKDKITFLTFHSKIHSEQDTARANKFLKLLKKEFEGNVPIEIIEKEFPGKEIEHLIKEIISDDEWIHGKMENLSETLMTTITSTPGEETGIHVSIDTTNLTEFFLDEVTNGATGSSNVSILNGIPKTITLDMCKYFGLREYLSSENSTTWEAKSTSYLEGATSEDDDKVFHALDSIFYLAILEEKTIKEIHEITGYSLDLIKNAISRTINYNKRVYPDGGQSYMGDFSSLKPKSVDYFKKKYIKNYREEIKKVLGL